MQICEKNKSKFKSILVSVNLLMPLKAEENSKNVLLPMVLTKASAIYPSERNIERALAELYNTTINIDVQKYSKYYNIEISIKMINKKYISRDVVYKGIEILNEIINNPHLKDGAFAKSVVNREKINLEKKIKTEKDDIRNYSLGKTQELLFKGEDYGYPLLGKIKDVKEINERNLYEHYKKALNKANPQVMVSGNLEGYEDLEEAIYKKIFGRNNNKKREIKMQTETTSTFLKKPNIVIKKRDTSQSVLCMGVKFMDSGIEEAFRAVILNTLLGGTPVSRMFQKIREKESLAYMAKSIYDINRNAIYILSGIDKKNYKRAKTLIIKELEDLKSGNIDECEVEAAKAYIIAKYKEIGDKKSSINRQKLVNKLILNEKYTIEDIIDIINRIKLKEVKELALKLNLQTVFLLGGGQNV